MTSRDRIVAVAHSYVGTPFHHQGRLPGKALDCAGVPLCISWELGIKPRTFDVTGYPMAPDGKTLQAYCDANMQRIPQGAMQAGDVVLIAWKDGPPQHLGILYNHCYGCLGIIHAESTKHSRVIETRLLFGRYMQFVAAYSMLPTVT